jgi:hypothetical protein
MSRHLRRALAVLALTCAAVVAPTPALAEDPAQTLPPASDPSVQGAPAPAPGAGAPTPQAQPAPKPAPGAADGAIARAVQGPDGDGGASAPVVVLVVAGVLLVIAVALVAAARWWAWQPGWLVRWRHATSEAGYRTRSAWAEFGDWLRLRR